MPTDGDDLDLLLSLREDRVLETPPASPSHLPGYLSDNGSPCASRPTDMSAFRDAVKDYLDSEPGIINAAPLKPNKLRRLDDVELDKFSGLSIRNSQLSSVELANRFSEIRFVRLQAIRNLLVGDTISGCWATAGVLTEKGGPKLSSAGKNYCVWKLGCFNESDVSVFLFGDAYTKNSKEPAGTVFALFNAAVRKDIGGNGFSLSVYSAGQLLKMGTSADYGICKGKRKDGMACTMVINKRKEAFCKFHKSKASQKYSTTRTELKGGNLHGAFKIQSEGIYTVAPLAERSIIKKPLQRVKVMSIDGLKKALSNADRVTTNSHSQGIRFLAQVTANKDLKSLSKITTNGEESKGNSNKRSSSLKEVASKIAKQNEYPQAKRIKSHQASEKMVELEIVSSDEEA